MLLCKETDSSWPSNMKSQAPDKHDISTDGDILILFLQFWWYFNIISNVRFRLLPGSLSPGKCNVMTIDVSNVAYIVNSDEAVLDEVETFHVHKIGTRWVPELMGCSGYGDVAVAETFTGVHDCCDAATIMDCSKSWVKKMAHFSAVS